jgi:hypothetical protein
VGVGCMTGEGGAGGGSGVWLVVAVKAQPSGGERTAVIEGAAARRGFAEERNVSPRGVSERRIGGDIGEGGERTT